MSKTKLMLLELLLVMAGGIEAQVLCKEFVFESSTFPSCHASTIACLQNGDLVTAFFGGSYEGCPDVCIWVCRKTAGSECWTEPAIAADGVINDTIRKACYNPVLFQMPDGELWLFYFICLGVSVLSQYGLGVEAGYFSAIWTRPVSISRVLKDKFMLAAALSGAAALISIPVCIWSDIPVYLPIAFALFATGVGCPIALIDAYNCTPFDLFGKTFFNYQGTKGTFKASTMLGMTVVLVLAILLPLLLSDLLAAIILGGLGLIGFAFHRPYFDWVERRFLKNKYKYMEKYLSK